MDERRGEGAERLTEEVAYRVGSPDSGAREAVDGGCGGSIVLAEDGALHKNGTLGLGEAVEPVTKAAASGAGHNLGDLFAGESGRFAVIQARRYGCSRRNGGEGSGVLAVHDFERSLQNAVADQTFGGTGIGAGINFERSNGVLDELQSFSLAAEHKGSEPIHFDCGVFGFEDGFTTGTGGFHHETPPESW
jgi:hypothetical protein